MSLLDHNFKVNQPPLGELELPVKHHTGTQKECAIRVIEAFGVPKLAYLGVNKDTIGRVSMHREAHWKCPHQKYLSVNIDFAAYRKRRVICIDIDDRFDDNAWLTIVDLINDGIIPAPAFASTRIREQNGDRRKTRAHMVYPLEFPVDEAKPRQKFFMETVLEEFYDILEAHGVPVDRNVA